MTLILAVRTKLLGVCVQDQLLAQRAFTALSTLHFLRLFFVQHDTLKRIRYKEVVRGYIVC